MLPGHGELVLSLLSPDRPRANSLTSSHTTFNAFPPGVARSIDSDVDNLMRLISVANVLPRGLYVESAVKVGGVG